MCDLGSNKVYEYHDYYYNLYVKQHKVYISWVCPEKEHKAKQKEFVISSEAQIYGSLKGPGVVIYAADQKTAR